MHQILLASALAATSGLFGGSQPSTCSSGQCGMTYYAAPAVQAPAPAMVYQPAPVYGPAPAMVQAPQAAVPVVPQYQPVYQAAPGTPLVYYYLPGSTCPNGTCTRR